MASYYIDSYAGSDFIDQTHSTFSDGVFKATTGTSGSNELTKTGAFSGLYAGDIIRLEDDGSGDVVVASYEIAHVVSNDVIRLTADITGGATETVSDVKAVVHTASESLPYGNITTFMASGISIVANDIIYIGNDKECKHRAGLTNGWTWSNVTTSSQAQAISIQAYAPGNSGGAAFVKTRADGTTTPIAKINGNGNTYITSTGTSGKYCGFVGIEFYNTTSWLVYTTHGWTFHDCKFHDATGSYLVLSPGYGNAFLNCEFDGTDVGSSTDAVQLNLSNFIIGSYIHDFPDNMVWWQNSGGAIMFNLFKNIGNAALNLRNRSWIAIQNNTFIAGNDNAIGCLHGPTATYQTQNRHNIFSGFTGTGTNAAGGTGGTGIYFDGANSNASTLGPNAFYNCTNNIVSENSWEPMTEFTDVSLSTDPFVDASAGDYSLETSSDAFSSITNMTLEESEAKLSYGAVQQVQAGGGGAAQTSHVSVGG